MGQPAAPGQENKEQQQVSEAQKLQTERAAQDNAFKAKPFEYVTKKWQDQIRQNETQFNDAVDGLRGYELALIKSLAEIEKIENQSVHVKNAYKDNMRDLNDVSLQQNALLSELCAIEGELDQILPQFTNSGTITPTGKPIKDNQFIKNVMSNPDMYETRASRERVFDEALNLEANIQ